MRKTKIVCTIGPACSDEETLTGMCEAGMNVARLNFSHGTHEEHRQKIELIKRVREKLGLPIAIMLDTKGPEYRIRTFKGGKVVLKEGDAFTFTTRQLEGDESIVSVSYAGLAQDLAVGDRVLVNNGLLIFEVTGLTETDVICRVIAGGELSDRKSMSFPNKVLKQVYLSEQDKSDLLFGIEQDVDFVACSFVSCRQDLLDVKEFLASHGSTDIELIAKIENQSGIDNIEEICDACSGIMIGRGDMGVEIPFEELPAVQKQLITKCRLLGKRVITATEMLESMIHNPRPTRAEISDVANAVYDGTSAIMLSGETSVGKYPVETVETMSRIAMNAEATIHYDRRRATRPEFAEMAVAGDDKTNAIAHAVCTTSADLDAKCIVAFTESGSTARAVSCRRPGKLIVGATPSEKTFHRLTMSWGVIPCMVRRPSSGTGLYMQAVRGAVEAMKAGVGDIIIVTAGMPVGRVSYTNTMRVIQVTEDYINLAFED